MSERPRLRLLPKIKPGKIRRGAPFVFANELVMDRRTRGIAPGTIATLVDNEQVPLATVAVNAGSKIVGRVLDANPEAVIDAAWLEARLASALALREAIYDAPFYRLCHGEGDGLSGLVADRYGDVISVQPNAAWSEALIGEIAEVLARLTGAGVIYKNASSRARKLEGLDDASTILQGEVAAPVEVPMNGALYLADIAGGQKTGLFLDQRENHGFAARLATGRSVLDVFCNVGGFGLAALAGGAERCLAVDGSQSALDLAAEAAGRMGAAERFSVQKGDAVKTMRALAEDGQRYGLVICDPPAFAPHPQALRAGLRGYEAVAQAAARLVEPGGFVALCSCSQAADLEAFRGACLTGIAKVGRRGSILHVGGPGPDHPTHPALAGQTYLKSLFFRLT